MWHNKNKTPWTRTRLIWMLLIVASASFVACTQRLQPNAADERACYLGVVPQADLVAVRQWAPEAKRGDLLISRGCDDRNTDDVLNDIRRMTHEDTRR